MVALGLCQQPGLALGHASPIVGHLGPLGIAIPQHNDAARARTGAPVRPRSVGHHVKRPCESRFIQQPVALAVIEQEFERRARAVAEDVDGALQGVVAQDLPAHGREAIDAFAEIDRLRWPQRCGFAG